MIRPTVMWLITLLITCGGWASDFSLEKTIVPDQLDAVQAAPVLNGAPEKPHASEAETSNLIGKDCYSQIPGALNVAKQTDSNSERENGPARQASPIQSVSRDRQASLLKALADRGQKFEGLQIHLRPDKNPSRDVDTTYYSYWTSSPELYYIYSSSFTSATWVGSIFVPSDDGIWPYKVTDFKFLNRLDTAPWQHVGVIQDGSWYPTTTAGTQFTNYYGPAMDWANLDMRDHDVYFDMDNLALHALINWCAGGGNCNSMGADRTTPSTVDWDTNSVDGVNWVTYTNLDWMHILTIEVMPDYGELAYYFPFPLGSTINHNTCANAASGVENDYYPPSSYTGGDGPDLIYNVYPPVNMNLGINLVPNGWDGMIYICTDYADIENTTIGFMNNGGLGIAETLNGIALTAETDYYVIIDGVGIDDCGDFDLTMSAIGLAPLNDTCSNPTNITTLPYSITSNTYNADDDYDGMTCGLIADGADVVYRYTPTAEEALSVTLTPMDFDGVLYITTACPPVDEADCIAVADMYGEGDAEAIACFLAVAGTTYYIFVDGYQMDDKGAFDLSIDSATIAANETCATAQTIIPGEEITGNTMCADDDYDGDCGTGLTLEGGDLAYSYTPTEDQVLAVILDPVGFDGVIYMVTTCTSEMTSCVAYADLAGVGGEENFCVDLTAGTTYYLIVDGVSGGGDLTLWAQLTTRPVNDTCDTAEAIPAIPLTYYMYGDGYLSCGGDDYDPTAAGCTGTDLPGPDTVYSYTPTENQNISFMASSYYGDFDIAVYVTTDCVDLTGCAGSDNGGIGVDEFIHCYPVTAGTTYYFVVDTPTVGLLGRYYFEIWPVETYTNEACASALTIETLPADIYGDTSCATNDYSPTMGGCFSTSADSPDLVYAYTTGSAAETVTVVFDPSFYTGSVYVVTDCMDLDNCLAGEYSEYPGAPVLLSCLEFQAATTYYIIVDGSLGDMETGRFTLHVEKTTPPANDDCATAQTISAFPALIETNTYCADNTYSLNMEGEYYLLGHDLVYHLTPTETGLYTFTMIPQDFYGAFLLIEGACETGTIIDGWLSIDPGTSRSLACVELTQNTNYYVIVDGDGFYDYGHFQFTIEQSGIPANDTCAVATLVDALPYSVQGSTICAGTDYDPLDGGCATYEQPGPDVVYSYTPASDATITVTMYADSFDGSIYMVTNCADPATSCVAGSDNYIAGYAESLGVVPVTAGITYYIIVDSWDTYESGAFTLTVEQVEIPENDTCETAASISALPYSVEGTTAYAGTDYDPGEEGCALFSQPGPDVVYSFAPATNMMITVTMESTAFDGSVYIVTDCMDPVNSCIAGSDMYVAGSAEVLQAITVSAGTRYNIIVDSWDTMEYGTFNLTVDEYIPPPIPATGPIGLGILLLAITGLLGFRSSRGRN